MYNGTERHQMCHNFLKLFPIFIVDAIVVWGTKQKRWLESVNVDESAQGTKRSDVGVAIMLPSTIRVSVSNSCMQLS